MSHDLSGPERVVVYTDGACRGNPGPSSAGWVIEDFNGAIIAQAGVFLGTGRNNGRVQRSNPGTEDAFQRGAREVRLRADSELMIKQLNGTYRKERTLKPLFGKLQEIIKKFDRIEFEHVKRHLNQAADEQANLALDARHNCRLPSALIKPARERAGLSLVPLVREESPSTTGYGAG